MPQRFQRNCSGSFWPALPAVVDAATARSSLSRNPTSKNIPDCGCAAPAGPDFGHVSPVSAEGKAERDRDFRVIESADYIAVTIGTRTLSLASAGHRGKRRRPAYQSIGVAAGKAFATARHFLDQARQVALGLVERAETCTAWISRLGSTPQTYKYYIDFAAKYGMPYIILDEGWYKLGNVLEVVPDINMEELTAYAKQKNVALFCGWSGKRSTINSIPALDQYAKWGVKGIKVDFMQRSDQL